MLDYGNVFALGINVGYGPYWVANTRPACYVGIAHDGTVSVEPVASMSKSRIFILFIFAFIVH